MSITADFEQEKHELDAVLNSGIFNRAPSLANLLTYICGKYFEGAAEQIKEYNIAVEALGRPAAFDQKKDSIVRVEAHRLRKRLREYYEGDGSAHPVQIVIPPGQYAPKFLIKDQLVAAAPPETTPVAIEPAPVVFDMVRRRRPAVWVGYGVLTFALAGLAVWAILPVRRTAAAPSPDFRAPIDRDNESVRIAAGLDKGNYVDRFGKLWESDRYFSGGSVFHLRAHPISGTSDPLLYQNRREGAFSYDVPLKPGVYELRLYFAETLFGENNIAGGGETSRIFHIEVNGKRELSDFDVISETGPSAADVKVFKNIAPAADGKLHVTFVPGMNSPFLNAIEISPGISGRMRPIRIAAQDRGFTDNQGRYWDPDHFSKGGQMVARTEPVSAAADPQLFRGERFGNVVYTIPVARGTYAVTFYFAEAWFGPGNPGGGGVGSRLFDILCNGVALARKFDIYAEAGRPNRAIARTFHHLEPNPQGKLIFSLVPEKNYACLNALEVVDESQ